MPNGPSAHTDSALPTVKANNENYRRQFLLRWDDTPHGLPWGHHAAMSPKTKRRYATMSRIVEGSSPTEGDAFLDISAGAGALSLPLAARFKLPVLADIAAESTAWLGQEKHTLVARADYLQSPFADGVFDFVLCTDTLIWGPDHDAILLETIWRALRSRGKALVTFHNRRHHNPLRSPHVLSYTKREVRGILSRLRPSPDVAFHSYYQEFRSNLQGWTRWARVMFPPTRFFVEIHKP
jgi:ubiquinone/menaquinone biosynthesis C-methylase UbiE